MSTSERGCFYLCGLNRCAVFMKEIQENKRRSLNIFPQINATTQMTFVLHL